MGWRTIAVVLLLAVSCGREVDPEQNRAAELFSCETDRNCHDQIGDTAGCAQLLCVDSWCELHNAPDGTRCGSDSSTLTCSRGTCG